MKKRKIAGLMALAAMSMGGFAQEKGLLNTSASKFAVLQNTDLSAVRWTDGFWGERFGVFRDTMILNMWNVLSNPDLCHAYRNLEIAAGEKEGEHWGPAFHDGDFYKWLESVASVYAVTKNSQLDQLMDKIITTITKAQREDGYIHTPVVIAERRQGAAQREQQQELVVGTAVGKEGGAFCDRLNFETYNLGHLMMAGCVHYRATGKRTLLDVAVKATDFLCHFYETATAELARNAICPSHYMGVVEMYRTTRNPRYLALARNLIDIRGMVENGTDDNQDRVPFRAQKTAMGHAVRANYLYAGVADVYAETGDVSLLENLRSIWKDIVTRKMYVTGACGALYDGTSPDGTCYEPDSIQKVHQSYGRAYQLPHSTAHNETCANIGNVLFNWRMFLITGEGKYTDVVETALYNSVLPGISLDGKKYFYTNPLRLSDEFPYTLRWPKERTPYISCFCCPPNTVRTLCEASNYAYGLSKDGIWVSLYGSNELSTTLKEGGVVKLIQKTNYPWEGNVDLTVVQMPRKKAVSLYLRIPGWCDGAKVTVNGVPVEAMVQPGAYTEIRREWKKGDVIRLEMEMPVKLLEANPLAEECRNQTVVKRGPLVYCLESADLHGIDMDQVVIPSDAKFAPVAMEIAGSPVQGLEGEVWVLNDEDWTGSLYREVNQSMRRARVRLIPYYAWGNRGHAEMTVWMPLNRTVKP